MITYQAEKYSEMLPEMKPLLPEHYEELGSPVATQYALEPDWDQYIKLEQAGAVKVVTCRSDGELVGYMIFMVSPGLHVKSCLTAYEDIYFLRKQYRKGRTGIKLFQFAEQYLKSLNVNKIMCTTKVHLDNSRLFEYLGYKFIEKIYSKFI